MGRVNDTAELDGPEPDIVGGSVLARGLLAVPYVGPQNATAGYPEAFGQDSLAIARMELDDRHRGGRSQVVRVDHRQQVLGEAREFRVDLQLHARSQEGEAFEQALHVGIGTLERLEPQPPGDLRELARELSPELAQILQLAVIVGEKPVVHQSVRARFAVNPGQWSPRRRSCPFRDRDRFGGRVAAEAAVPRVPPRSGRTGRCGLIC